MGKLLSSENDLLCDQRGSPAYISPDVLCGKPYLGNQSHMYLWFLSASDKLPLQKKNGIVEGKISKFNF